MFRVTIECYATKRRINLCRITSPEYIKRMEKSIFIFTDHESKVHTVYLGQNDCLIIKQE